MAVRERILAALRRADGPLCDDCLVPAAQLRRRQQANSECRRLAKEDLILRGRGPCSVCVKHKLVNAPHPSGGASSAEPPSHPPVRLTPGDGYDPDRPWYWEGNVQARLIAWLKHRGYRIRRAADTASKEHGLDIIACKDGKELWVSVKGYPERRGPLQARHWFADAVVFGALLHRDAHPHVQLALAFPRFPTYRRLISRVNWLTSKLPLDIYWVEESGAVTRECGPR